LRPLRAERQSRKKGSAFSFPTLEPDVPAVALDDGLSDEETESGAVRFGARRVRRAEKTREDLVLFAVGNADTLVFDGKSEIFVFLGKGDMHRSAGL